MAAACTCRKRREAVIGWRLAQGGGAHAAKRAAAAVDRPAQRRRRGELDEVVCRGAPALPVQQHVLRGDQRSNKRCGGASTSDGTPACLALHGEVAPADKTSAAELACWQEGGAAGGREPTWMYCVSLRVALCT